MFSKHCLGLLMSPNITHTSTSNTYLLTTHLECFESQSVYRFYLVHKTNPSETVDISQCNTHLRIKHISAEQHLECFERQRVFIVLFRAAD